MSYEKRRVPWNKGKKASAETRKKISESMHKQYADGTRNRETITRVANEAVKKRTEEKEKSGDMTKYIDKYGHIYIYTSKGAMREQRYVWEKQNGPIPEGRVIHHKNGLPWDNKIENLQLMTQSEHMKLHNIPRNEKGQFIKTEEAKTTVHRRGTSRVEQRLTTEGFMGDTQEIK